MRDDGCERLNPRNFGFETVSVFPKITASGESLNLAVNAVADVLHALYIEAHTERRGDLNGDGQVTTADAIIALQMAVSGEYSEDADMTDDDGRVTSVDALMILQVVESECN